MRVRATLPFLLLLLGSLASAAAESADNTAPETPPTDAEVAATFAQIAPQVEGIPLALVWPSVFQLERLGPRIVPLVRGRAGSSASPLWRLVLAHLTLRGEEPAEGVSAVTDLLTGEDAQAAEAAARLLAGASNAPAIQALAAALESEARPERRVALAAALWEAARSPVALRKLDELRAAQDPAVARSAILALAEGGRIDPVRTDLERMQMEPTPEGARARAVLVREQLASAAAVQGDPDLARQLAIVRETMELVDRYYIEPKEVGDLGAAAARGVATALDPNCTYYTEEELAEHLERYQGEYAGVGAHVSKDPVGYVLIVSPMYGGPAYQAGLRAGDRITEIEGKSTLELTLEEAVDRIRGPTGTPVTFKIFRDGLTEPLEFTLARATVQLPSVFSELLPGKIGYIRLTHFGARSAGEMRGAVVSLQNEGVRGWMLDLRGNPGGLLTTAVQVCDLFLPPGQLIVYSEGRNPDVARRRDFTSGGFMHRFRNGDDWVNPDLAERLGLRAPRRLADATTPMVVLVDRGSASGSEVVAGCLQDHRRAALVGARSFGKGSVQDEFTLQSTDRKTRFKLTVAKYYLPSGRCIHGSGIDPDVVSEAPALEGWKLAEARALGGQEVFSKYLDERFEANRDLFARLAQRDGSDASLYPGFDAWYDTLQTRLPKNDIRRYLRAGVRERLANDRGTLYAVDPALDDDPQLQRAIVSLTGAMGLDPESVEEYRGLRARFAEATPAETR